MNNKGIVVLIIILVIIGGGIYLLMNKGDSSTTVNNQVFTPTENTEQEVPASNTPVSNNELVAPTTYNMDIKGFAFAQSSTTIKKGDTIVWTNRDSVSHTVTGTNGGPSSSLFGLGQTYSYTFNSTGTFPYYCIPHPNMKGTVIVE